MEECKHTEQPSLDGHGFEAHGRWELQGLLNHKWSSHSRHENVRASWLTSIKCCDINRKWSSQSRKKLWQEQESQALSSHKWSHEIVIVNRASQSHLVGLV